MKSSVISVIRDSQIVIIVTTAMIYFHPCCPTNSRTSSKSKYGYILNQNIGIFQYSTTCKQIFIAIIYFDFTIYIQSFRNYLLNFSKVQRNQEKLVGKEAQNVLTTLFILYCDTLHCGHQWWIYLWRITSNCQNGTDVSFSHSRLKMK